MTGCHKSGSAPHAVFRTDTLQADLPRGKELPPPPPTAPSALRATMDAIVSSVALACLVGTLMLI